MQEVETSVGKCDRATCTTIGVDRGQQILFRQHAPH
jgi:hypothetical protein